MTLIDGPDVAPNGIETDGGCWKMDVFRKPPSLGELH